MSNTDREITVTLSTARGVYDTDWNGRIIEEADDALAKLNCTIDIEKERRVTFGILAAFPKIRIKQPDDKHIDDRLGFLTWKTIPIYLANFTQIDLFRTHRICLFMYLGKRLPKTVENSSEYLSPFKCTITSDAFQDIINQFTEYSAARRSFDYAVNRLREFADYTPYGLKCHQSEIFSLLCFLERLLGSADAGHLHGWYREKQSGIRSRFNDMFRRKQENHPGYKRAQDYIRRNLFLYRAPDVWHEHPPILQDVTQGS